MFGNILSVLCLMRVNVPRARELRLYRTQIFDEYQYFDFKIFPHVLDA